MSRRPRRAFQFGSDSFLDIVCNVVGILIILMVVAGLRASRAPVQLPTLAVAEVPAPPPIPESDGPPLPLLIAEEESEPAPPVHVAPPEPVVLEPVVPPPELVTQSERLRQELDQLQQQNEAATAKMVNINQQQSELQEKLQALGQQQTAQTEQLELLQQKRAATQLELDHLQRVMAQLQQTLKQQEAKSPPAKSLQHRINPIGQAVTGNELHFRVLNNRVIEVPLDQLVGRLKGQIERHKDWIAKSRQQLGEIGPIDGFTMHYVVERDAGSLADELRMGPGVFRISVTEWQLEAERNLPDESAAEALRPGSRFLSALSRAEQGTAITFWVYPDSFGAYTQLKEHSQKMNFLIAGRPLPDGIPIAGSPAGTRSTGQ